MTFEDRFPPQNPDPYRELHERAGDDVTYFHLLMAVDNYRRSFEDRVGTMTDEEYLQVQGHLGALKTELAAYEISKGYAPGPPPEQSDDN